MTERWRESLSELDTVKPSPDVWDRAVAQSAQQSWSDLRGEGRGRLLAVVVALALATVGAVIAFVSLGELATAPQTHGGRPEPDGFITYRDPTGTWEIDHPLGFRQGIIPRLSQHPRVAFEGIWIANFDPPEPPDEAGGPLYYEVPDIGVVVLVYQVFGGPFNLSTERDSAFPIRPDDLGVELGLYSGRWLTGNVVANGETYTIAVRMGAEASQQDEEAAAGIVSSFRVLPVEEGTSIGRIVTFFVLGPRERYPIGSVTRLEPSDLPVSDGADLLSFYLVHTPDGFYAIPGWYQNCVLSYEEGAREFTCQNGARWALDGSMTAKPDPTMPDDPLRVLLVRISLDGHVLVSPDVSLSDTSLDLRLT